MKQLLSVATVLLTVVTTVAVAQITSFPPALSSSSAFTDITNLVDLGTSAPLRVSSLIDWQNDKNIDLVGVREDNPSCVQVRAWKRDDSKSKAGKFSTTIDLTPGCTNASWAKLRKYTAAVAVDMNRDGLLDVVATHEDNVDLFLQQKGSTDAAMKMTPQLDVLKFPAAQMGSTTLLKGSSVNVVGYFAQCAALDLVAVNSDGNMIVFRNALDTPPDNGGESCTNANWEPPANITFVPELGTIVKNVVAGGTTTADLDGDCTAEFLFATRNAASRKTEIRAAPLAGRKIDQTSTKNANGVDISSSSSSTAAGAAMSLRSAEKLESTDDEDSPASTETSLILTVPDDFGPPTWADFDGDGAIDVAFAVCVEPLAPHEAAAASSTAAPSSSRKTKRGDHKIVNCSIANNFTGVLVIRNVNSGVCDKTDCCKRVDSFSFASISHGAVDLPVSAMLTAVTYHVVPAAAPSSSSSASSSSAAAAASSSSASSSSAAKKKTKCFLRSGDAAMMPLKIRPGDINDDGKNDAVVSSTCGPLILFNTGSGGFTAQPFVTDAATNIPGENGAADLAMLSAEEALPFFFDVNDDGRLDVVISHRGNFSLCNAAASSSGNDTSAKTCIGGVFAFWHRGNEDQTNYFITAATLNAARPLPDAAWGAVQPGATVRFQHLDIDNDVHSAGATQLGSTAYFELALPRPHFGIGLTFASVMNFASGFHIEGKRYHSSWPSVYLTPNSQILCIPYPVKDPGQWVVRLYLIGEWDLQLVLISWLVALSVIGIPILVLGVREVHEDRRSFGLT